MGEEGAFAGQDPDHVSKGQVPELEGVVGFSYSCDLVGDGLAGRFGAFSCACEAEELDGSRVVSGCAGLEVDPSEVFH